MDKSEIKRKLEAHKKYLQGEEYSGIGAFFQNVDISDYSFHNEDLTWAIFENVKMNGTQFLGCVLRCAEFHNVEMTYTLFDGCILDNVIFKNCDMTGIHIHGSSVPALFQNVNLKNSVFEASSFMDSYFSMHEINFQNVHASYCDFRGTRLSPENFDYLFYVRFHGNEIISLDRRNGM